MVFQIHPAELRNNLNIRMNIMDNVALWYQVRYDFRNEFAIGDIPRSKKMLVKA